jgi:hypothetical protein
VFGNHVRPSRCIDAVGSSDYVKSNYSMLNMKGNGRGLVWRSTAAFA